MSLSPGLFAGVEAHAVDATHRSISAQEDVEISKVVDASLGAKVAAERWCETKVLPMETGLVLMKIMIES